MAASWRILEGDCRDRLAELDPGSVQTCVTSPPYFGLRDYGTSAWDGGDAGCDHLGEPFRTSANINRNWDGGNDVKNAEKRQPFKTECGKCGARRVDRQLGLEAIPDEFVQALVAVFREVRRVLRDDGTVWLNLGDSYVGGGGFSPDSPSNVAGAKQTTQGGAVKGTIRPQGTAKAKDLLGIPWMVAFALRADGWYLRMDNIWSKPNPMPESVTDRPTKAHEYVFLLSKGPRYYYDADAIQEDAADSTAARAYLGARPISDRQQHMQDVGMHGASDSLRDYSRTARNKRSVWTVATQPYPGAHFATFPPKLIEPCILAGAPEHGIVLDPFAGTGTTGLVALRHGRSFIGIELSSAYAQLARIRIVDDAPLLNSVAEVA